MNTDGVSQEAWAMGDLNLDGSDATILANYWQHGVAPPEATVPEPSTMALLASLLLIGSHSYFKKHRASA